MIRCPSAAVHNLITVGQHHCAGYENSTNENCVGGSHNCAPLNITFPMHRQEGFGFCNATSEYSDEPLCRLDRG